MKPIVAFFLFLVAFFVSSTAFAQAACPAGKVCVDKKDMTTFLEIAKEKRCLVSTQPEVKADPLTIVVDKQGRVYGSGSGPQPFKLHLTWCNYELDATGQTKIVAAQMVEPDWGFRFRPKAALGLLGADLLRGEKFTSTIDGGALIEPFYYHFLNVNAYVGVRSVGGGLGIDLTRNFGLYMGYAITWDGWRSNVMVGAYFSFL